MKKYKQFCKNKQLEPKLFSSLQLFKKHLKMNNPTLIKAARKILLDLLNQCTVLQQNLFQRMYSGNKEKDKSIEDVIKDMSPYSLDNAISQTEATIKKNKNEH